MFINLPPSLIRAYSQMQSTFINNQEKHLRVDSLSKAAAFIAKNPLKMQLLHMDWIVISINQNTHFILLIGRSRDQANC